MRDAKRFEEASDDAPALAQLKRSVLLHRRLRRAIAVHPRQQGRMPRKDVLLIIAVAVDRCHHVTGDASVSDEPAEVVREVIAPLLGQPKRSRPVTLDLVLA